MRRRFRKMTPRYVIAQLNSARPLRGTRCVYRNGPAPNPPRPGKPKRIKGAK